MSSSPKYYDAAIIGAGAAGLMCAIEAAKRGKKVVVLEQADAPAEKIRISGGGRCNFTHLRAHSHNYLSQNPRFCISALKRYTPRDFVSMVERHKIAYHEKTEGQLFCDESAMDIIDMLLNELRDNGGELWLQTAITAITKNDAGFEITTTNETVNAKKVVIATGGLSIPKLGSPFAYETAKQFGHTITPMRAGLVPLTLSPDKLQALGLAGVSMQARVKVGKTKFEDGFLFTHRGLSGPAILQISNYWQMGQTLEIDLRPDMDLMEWFRAKRKTRQSLHTALFEILPRRLAEKIMAAQGLSAETNETKIADMSDVKIKGILSHIQPWSLIPDGTEGYRTAEVTLGGIDTKDISSQTFESQLCAGLYFVGEALDVTGWLGGYNFQWAWSSGWAAGQAI
ncbi:NAD(P)/FAD-dependent oxidoreductase [Asticcacaulis endophyticus]|uniref:NAD(P)/FAD-dependent oxidoreductase n=1 Tax=Asticcacaulis endophyticus TaxID=1395890 RepID=A0A918QB81_9CAUL|nr:NAD(P)/FAD-dependent oxidoreductase [Asticcacaulis endophyticus]GGZ40626.1 hypothetical protein GCM10011273_29190 [Asticcacaulis endophyticus]